MVVRKSNVQAAAAAVAVGKLLAHALQHLLVGADRLADDQRAGVLQRLADLFTARNFADAGAPGVVGEDQQVAGEKRAVRAAQVEQHAVAPGDSDDAQFGDNRRARCGLRQGRLTDSDFCGFIGSFLVSAGSECAGGDPKRDHASPG